MALLKALVALTGRSKDDTPSRSSWTGSSAGQHLKVTRLDYGRTLAGVGDVVADWSMGLDTLPEEARGELR